VCVCVVACAVHCVAWQLATDKRAAAAAAATAQEREGEGPLVIERGVRILAAGPGVAITFADAPEEEAEGQQGNGVQRARRRRQAAKKKAGAPVLLDVSAPPGSVVKIEGVDVLGPPEAQTVQLWSGALVMEACQLQGCLGVNGIDATATLRECEIHTSEHVGCSAFAGASVWLEGGSVRRCAGGVVASGQGRTLAAAKPRTSRITVIRTAVTECVQYGARACQGALVSFKEGAEQACTGNGHLQLRGLMGGRADDQPDGQLTELMPAREGRPLDFWQYHGGKISGVASKCIVRHSS
jgi:hypothetical protein